MATKKEADLTPPERSGPDATEAEVQEFDRQRQEHEQARHEAQVETAEKSPQTQDAP